MSCFRSQTLTVLHEAITLTGKGLSYFSILFYEIVKFTIFLVIKKVITQKAHFIIYYGIAGGLLVSCDDFR